MSHPLIGHPHPFRLRLFALALTVVLALPAVGDAKPKDKHSLAPRDTSGVDHIVVVMMENRSFDHFLGWHPTADGMQAGLTYPDALGGEQPTYALAPDYQGCTHPDPDHSWEGGRVNVNDGAMNGFLLTGMNDEYAIGYYDQTARPFFNALALEYTTFDRFFSSILGETVFDNTSILKLIEWRWNLKPLTARDASSDVGNLAFALDLANPDATVPGPSDPHGATRATLRSGVPDPDRSGAGGHSRSRTVIT